VINDETNLEEVQSHISAAIPTLDQPGGYGHNVISACLRLIAEHHGKDAANETIRELKLDKKGWNEQ
jgi:hypothetical protein